GTWRGRRGGRGVECRIVVEDRGLDLLQGATRVDAELVAKGPPGVVDGPQRVGLASRAVQRERQARPETLPPRMGAHELAQLADERGVTTEREVGRDAVLDGCEPALLEPGHEPARELALAILGERRSPPEGVGFEERGSRPCRV